MKLSPARILLVLLFVFIGRFGVAYAAAGHADRAARPLGPRHVWPEHGFGDRPRGPGRARLHRGRPRARRLQRHGRHQWDTLRPGLPVPGRPSGLASLAVLVVVARRGRGRPHLGVPRAQAGRRRSGRTGGPDRDPGLPPLGLRDTADWSAPAPSSAPRRPRSPPGPPPSPPIYAAPPPVPRRRIPDPRRRRLPPRPGRPAPRHRSGPTAHPSGPAHGTLAAGPIRPSLPPTPRRPRHRPRTRRRPIPRPDPPPGDGGAGMVDPGSGVPAHAAVPAASRTVARGTARPAVPCTTAPEPSGVGTDRGRHTTTPSGHGTRRRSAGDAGGPTFDPPGQTGPDPAPPA